MPFHVWLLTIIIMALSGSVEQPLEVIMISTPCSGFPIPHRAINWQVTTGVQVSMWTELPQEVIEIVMKDMSQGDLWTCRDISSCWAAAAKASGLLKLVTSRSPSAGTKVSVKLSRLHHLKISNSQVQCCLKVEPPNAAACAAMLEPLTDQVMLARGQLQLLTVLTVNRRTGRLRSGGTEVA